MRKPVTVLVVVTLGMLALGGGASAVAPAPFPGQKLDLFSAPPVDLSLVDAVAVGASGISGAGQPPRVGPNVRVNAPQAGLPNGLFGRSETTLTVHGQNVVAGWNDAQGFCGPPFGVACTPQSPAGLSGYGYSTDGGASWTDGGAPDPFGGVLSRGDPWMDDNGSGTFYYANLAVNALTGASLGVGVWRGAFNGGSFAWSDVTAFDSPDNATTPNDDFYDKEAIASGKNAYRNDAYVTLTNFQQLCGFQQNGFGQIEVFRTHDGGATWHGPAIAGPETPDSAAACGFAGGLQQSSSPAVGPKGEVYVVWQLGPTFAPAGTTSADADIVIAKSTDGGVTWTTPAKVADINSSRANPPIGYNRERVNDHPRVDVATTGKHKGRVYVTYYGSVSPVPSTSVSSTQQVLVDIQTYLKYSDDGGATWSSPVEIGGPIPAKPAGVGAIKRWWPDVSVGPGGDVHVVYYEEQATNLTASATECPISIGGGLFRNGTYSSLLDSWWTYSKDGGATWSMPLKVSERTSNVCRTASNIRPNLGDYNDAEAFGGNKVGTTWAGGPNFDPANPDPATTPIVPIDTIYAVGKG